MLVKVRTGYGHFMKGVVYKPGEFIDIPEKEYDSLCQKFELVETPKVEEKKEEPVLENRAILDSTAGQPIARRGKRGR